MTLKLIFFALLIVTAAPLHAQQVDPEKSIQNGKYLDAAKEYASRMNQNSSSSDTAALANACIGLYKVLWLNQTQDTAAQLFKTCPVETMDWLSGKVDRNHQPIRKTIIGFPPGMIYHVLDKPITFGILFDLDVFGKPTNVRINGLKQIGGSQKTRAIEQSLITQVMEWRYLPSIVNKTPVETKDIPSDVIFSAERR